ncbi:MAG: hypothetical protein EU540_02095 [Promethearchaeota archaeon]|nr:MAG: hypothetical protein EU540_02095 [Candidatus Lokiarchaeota archaeon]
MSEEEIIEEIKNVFLKLTEGEPTPDDEIEAREILIQGFKLLKDENLIHGKADLIEDTINKLENWDTLDLWFKEVNGLAENITKMLDLRDMGVESESTDLLSDSKEDIESKPEIASKNIDITEIVAQVSEQFKGEIEGLKGTIDLLKKELQKKEEAIKEPSQEPEVQEEIPQEPEVEEKASNLKGKLAPLKIKIPLVKKPQKPLKIKVPIESEEAAIEKIGDSGVDKEMEPEIITEVPKEPSISQVSIDELKDMIEPKEEPQITTKPKKKSKLTPIIMEEPTNESSSEIPFKPTIEPESDEEKEKSIPLPVKKPKIIQSITETSMDTEKSKPSSIPFEMPEETSKATEKSKLSAIPFEMPEETSKTTEKSKLSVIPFEMPKETSKATEKSKPTSIPFGMPEETEEVKGETKIEQKEESTPLIFPNKKPEIIPIDVEDIDTESINSSGKDLFNVFSSVGVETPEEITSKGKKKKVEKEKIIAEIPQEIKPVPIAHDEPLPTDKDALYQELIALEGRRYSLEKGYKELSNNYNSGIIDDYEYKNQNEGLRNNLDEISSRIAKIRRLISSL